MKLLILPHQLFDIKKLPSKKEMKEIILFEHPQYFTKYNFNKKKLVLHRASMKYYFDYLIKKGYNVKYVNYDKGETIKNCTHCFDPIDKINLSKFGNGNGKMEMLESPNFMCTKENYLEYRKKTQTFFFNSFYMWCKKKVDIIPDIKSQDKYNRNSFDSSIPIPKLPKNSGTSDKKYIEEAKKYVESNFKSNYGEVDNFQFPISHTAANKWLSNFISSKFKVFGPYQDFIVKGEDYMFHSCLSTSINIGLLNPLDIIEKIKPLKSKIPLNSYEGYIRQLFWREYQRFCYIHFDFKGKNYFGHKKKLSKSWYYGTLGIEPVDDAIKSGFKTGYLHHIIRLMVVGNYMNLTGISPMEGLRWFMEFSCDSYEWVMYQNVLDMVFCVSGGKTMRKPYASSSNYIIKMSNYKKGDWSEKWDKEYNNFMKKHKTKLWKFRYHFPGLKKL